MFCVRVKTFLIFLLLIAQPLLFAENSFFVGKVSRVVAGDRIVLQGGTVVQYAGIEVPKLSDPRPQFQRIAKNALKLNEAALQSKTVRLELLDPELSDNPQGSRREAYAYSGGAMINAKLLKSGLAILSSKYGEGEKYFDYFRSSQAVAYANKLGIWKVLRAD